MNRRYRFFVLFLLLTCPLVSYLTYKTTDWEQVALCNNYSALGLKVDCIWNSKRNYVSPPVQDVRRLTYDFAFYSRLLWSPDGRYLAAERCHAVEVWGLFEYFGATGCDARLNGDTVIIDVKTGRIDSIDFGSITSSSIRSRPEFWSAEGKRLLIQIEKNLSSPNPGKGGRNVDEYLIFNFEDKSLQRVESEFVPIAWLSSEESLLIIDADFSSLGTKKESKWFIGRTSLTTSITKTEYTFILNRFSSYRALSPNRQTLLLGDTDDHRGCDGVVYSYALGSSEKLTRLPIDACYPVWSPNGKKVAYVLAAGWTQGIMIANNDGSNSQSLFGIDPRDLLPTSSLSWSPDGKQLAFTYGSNDNVIYVVDLPDHLQEH